MLDKEDLKAHKAALSIAVFGPLVNYFLKPLYMSSIPSVFLYWSIILGLYVAVLFKFFTKRPLTIFRLVVLGIAVEDFFSGLWNSLFTGVQVLPMLNWYKDYFPFFDVLGEPMVLIGIPIWHVAALLAYLTLTGIQYGQLWKR